MRYADALAATLALAAAAACGDATGVEPEDLAGTWDIAVLEFTNEADDTEKVDVIADLQGSGTVTITGAGAFTVSVTVDGSTDTDNGTIEVAGNDVTLTFGSDELTGTIVRDGDVATISITDGGEYDFDDDGAAEAATIRLEMDKR